MDSAVANSISLHRFIFLNGNQPKETRALVSMCHEVNESGFVFGAEVTGEFVLRKSRCA